MSASSTGFTRFPLTGEKFHAPNCKFRKASFCCFRPRTSNIASHSSAKTFDTDGRGGPNLR